MFRGGLARKVFQNFITMENSVHPDEMCHMIHLIGMYMFYEGIHFGLQARD